ncbi:MAG: transposase [Treponema sp.]|jgi:REP element-mobilizing transposase RayT|nr:transposase [Treponema sp.]
MARKERGNTALGYTYHVTFEINRWLMELKNPLIKALVIPVIAEAHRKYGFKLWNFCIMDNHIHVLITPDKDVSLSVIMKWIKMVVAIRWNKLHGVKGHLWGDRFHARMIESSEDFLRVFRYINQNPIKAGLVEQWIFGGLYHYLHNIVHIVPTFSDLLAQVFTADFST